MTTKTIKTLKALKKILKKTLPEKISKVLQSYDNFSKHNEPTDAKSFGAYHSALKSAIVHAQTLLKLANFTSEEQNSGEIDESSEFLAFLHEAQSLKQLAEEEYEDDEESRE